MSSLFLRSSRAASSTIPHRLVAARTRPILKNECRTFQRGKTIIHSSRASYQLISTRNFFFFEEKEDNRIRDIQPNPNGIGSKIKPGNLVDKFYEKTGNTRTIPTELAYGYFWMIKDLSNTGGKPIISNQHLIPAKNSQPFPSLLAGLQTLNGEAAELPNFFLRKNSE
jgi:hypothetical protein